MGILSGRAQGLCAGGTSSPWEGKTYYQYVGVGLPFVGLPVRFGTPAKGRGLWLGAEPKEARESNV